MSKFHQLDSQRPPADITTNVPTHTAVGDRAFAAIVVIIDGLHLLFSFYRSSNSSIYIQHNRTHWTQISHHNPVRSMGSCAMLDDRAYFPVRSTRVVAAGRFLAVRDGGDPVGTIWTSGTTSSSSSFTSACCA